MSIKTSVGRRSRTAPTAEEKTRMPCGRHHRLGVATSDSDASVIGPRIRTPGTAGQVGTSACLLRTTIVGGLPLLLRGVLAAVSYSIARPTE